MSHLRLAGWAFQLEVGFGEVGSECCRRMASLEVSAVESLREFDEISVF